MNILITNACGNIGSALALEYATKGNTLLLADSDSELLVRISEACKLRGARVITKVCDFKDYVALGNWIEHCDSDNPVDIVMINSDIVPNSSMSGMVMYDRIESWEQLKNILDINLHGVLCLLLAAVALMKKRGVGKIMLLSSFASAIHLPGFGSYSASKAGVRFYVNSIRDDLEKVGISVFMVYLSSIRDSVNGKNLLSLPSINKPDKIANKIKQALESGKKEFHTHPSLSLLTYLLRLLPDWLLFPILKRLRSC